MKRVAEAKRGVGVVPVVIEPVPIQLNLVAVLDEVRDVEVAVAVQHKHTECRLCHCPLSVLGAVSYSASTML